MLCVAMRGGFGRFGVSMRLGYQSAEATDHLTAPSAGVTDVSAVSAKLGTAAVSWNTFHLGKCFSKTHTLNVPAMKNTWTNFWTRRHVANIFMVPETD